MIEVDTLGQAHELTEHEGRKRIKIEATTRPRVYFEGDLLPSHMVVPAPNPTLEEINALEQSVTPRTLREAALGNSEGRARLKAIDDQIAGLRKKL